MACVMVGGGRLAASVSSTFTQSDGTISASEFVQFASIPLPLVVNNRAETNTTGPGGATTLYAARHVTSLETDDVRVRCYLYAASATPNASLGGGPLCRIDPSTGVRIALVPTANSLSIVTVAAGAARTTRATTGSLSITAGSYVELEAIGDVVNGYLNGAGTPTVTWSGANAVVPGGVGKRAHGFEVSSTKDFVGSVISARGWALDDYLARDM